MGTQHNKLDSDGQRLRRYEIIRFIKDNGPVKASAVMERFGIKKQALETAGQSPSPLVVRAFMPVVETIRHDCKRAFGQI